MLPLPSVCIRVDEVSVRPTNKCCLAFRHLPSSTEVEEGKLQALVYDILPPWRKVPGLECRRKDVIAWTNAWSQIWPLPVSAWTRFQFVQELPHLACPRSDSVLSTWWTHRPMDQYRGPCSGLRCQRSAAVWKSRWPSWAFRPKEPYGFRGRKATLNHAHALVSACP